MFACLKLLAAVLNLCQGIGKLLFGILARLCKIDLALLVSGNALGDLGVRLFNKDHAARVRQLLQLVRYALLERSDRVAVVV